MLRRLEWINMGFVEKMVEIERARGELDTYKKLAIGDTVEIQQEDTYRLGVYIYTSYYFVKKIK